MGFFNKKAQMVTREKKDDLVVFNVKYYKSQNPKKYKLELLSKILGTSPCLAVINTKYMYKDQKRSFDENQQALFDKLTGSGTGFRRVPVRREEDVSIFGLSVRQVETKYYLDYVYGLVVDGLNMERLISIVGAYCIYYYTDCGTAGAEEILDLFEASFDDAYRLKESFRYSLFDDSFIENMVISCKEEDASYISNLLD